MSAQRLPSGWLALTIMSRDVGGPTQIVCPREDLHGFLAYPAMGTRILLHGEALFVLNTIEDLLQQLQAQEEDQDEGGVTDPGEPIEEEVPERLQDDDVMAYHFQLRVGVAKTDAKTMETLVRSIEDVHYPNHAIMPQVVGPLARDDIGFILVNILVVDHDEVGAEGARQMLQAVRKPPFNGLVIYKCARNIGAWRDDHPLNRVSTMRSTFEDIFDIKLSWCDP